MTTTPSASGNRSFNSTQLYERVRRVIPAIEWPLHVDLIADIIELKRERNATVLAHNYQTPEIYHCVSDVTGDSLALARQAAETDARVIVMAGVHFMAETVKLLNPEKIVLIPDAQAGCSLAAAITAADVEHLREVHPGVPVVTYINTTAEVKAAADICCTSGNAVKIVESLGCEEVIFIPDEYLANYVAKQTKVRIISWHGRCEVHERFTGEEIQRYRENLGDVMIVAHPECPPDVLYASDFVGSTAEMISYVKREQPKRVVMLTECSMSDNVAAEVPEVEFTRPCNLCPHMKRITLAKIRQALQTLEPWVEISEEIAEKARASILRMLAVH